MKRAFWHQSLYLNSKIVFIVRVIEMEGSMELKVGDVIKMKKSHPCGTNAWELRRVGMDIRMQCKGCGHQVMLPRKQVEKGFRGFLEQ